MNCAQANQIDMVSYLYSLGFLAKKVRGDDHWYLSPLREEKTASFKINYRKNVWYDHGIGEGGTMVDFVTRYFHCNVATALEKLAAAPGSLRYTQTSKSLHAPTTIGSDTQSAVEPGIHIVNNKHVGNLVWQKSIGGSKADFVTDVKSLPDNSIIVASCSESGDGDFTSHFNTGTGYDLDIWV